MREITKREYLELLYFPLFILLFFWIQHKIEVISDTNLREKILSMTESFLFGTFHLLASNSLSFLYNLPKAIPFFGKISPTATPKKVKVIGSIFVMISLIHFIATFF
jgi:hypothetical protein